MNETDGKVMQGIDSGLVEGSQSILLDFDPQLSLEFLKEAAALSGKRPPAHATREQLLAMHNEFVSKSVKDGKNGPRPVKKVILSLAYPPSTKPIRDLEKILLDGLLVEMHHEDKFLVVRSVTAPFSGVGTVAVVEDETGYADKIAIYNQGEASILSDIPEGLAIAIKEPYYKFNGEDDYMICVDHPSDILVLELDNTLVPPAFRPSSNGTLHSITAGDDSLKRTILAKRAGTNLNLSCFDAALADALESRDGDTHDWKAYLVAGKSAYALQRYQESKEYFLSALDKNPAALGVKQEYEKCLARIREEEEGIYDFASMREQADRGNVHMDCGSFTKKTTISTSQHHGRGLFAAQDVKAGELLYCEKAVCMPNEYNVQHNGSALYANMVEQCVNNPSMHARTLELYGGKYKRSGLEGTTVDGVEIVDNFLLESIRRTNCFMAPSSSLTAAQPGWTMEKGGMARGMWLHAAAENHSCFPNSIRAFIGDMLIAVATDNIKAGEEIYQVYLPPKAIYTMRTDQFVQWSFKCGCQLCLAEAKSPMANHERRKQTFHEIDIIISKTKKKSGLFIQQSTIRSIEKLTRKLEDLHEDEIYGSMPRLMLVWPTMWLTEAYRNLKHHAKTIRSAWQVIRNFGFVNAAKEGNWDIFATTPTGITAFEVDNALRHARDAYTALGEVQLAAQCAASSRMAWRMLVGFDNEASRLSDWIGDEYKDVN
ncbi:TPR domain-containing protein [Pseudomassariella vexata]|uniref:TPR domain-containing protein n=1 Tax=Pseudomassariella vexata TaxID=1141098 RepID=A0A1Y2DQK1_9PEZI|nr:TPR domain-containing protein [Pseudomassariella vexata]ORY61449.1 TPR domain-containing protein [Pseudomassariella vexata]